MIKIVLLTLLADLLDFHPDPIQVIVDDYLQRKDIDVWLDFRYLRQQIVKRLVPFDDGIKLSLNIVVCIIL